MPIMMLLGMIVCAEAPRVCGCIKRHHSRALIATALPAF